MSKVMHHDLCALSYFYRFINELAMMSKEDYLVFPAEIRQDVEGGP